MATIAWMSSASRGLPDRQAIESFRDVAQLVKSFGVDLDVGKLAEDFVNEDQVAFVTTWNRTECRAAKLEVAFAGDTRRAEGLGDLRYGENEVMLTLIDCVTGKQVRQDVVPLALIENPRFSLNWQFAQRISLKLQLRN